MTHTGHSTNTNLAVLEDVVDLRVDDQAHRFVVVCGPEQAQRSVSGQELDGTASEADRDGRARELWRDVRDARRTIRG